MIRDEKKVGLRSITPILNKFRILKASHCGAILSTAPQFGINPMHKKPMDNTTGSRLFVFSFFEAMKKILVNLVNLGQ